MKIELDGIPPSLNSIVGRGAEWRYRAEKKKWTDYTCLMAGSHTEPIQRACVHIHYIFPDRRRHDPDNYCGKFILDGLTHAGVIADDSFDCIKLELSAEYIKGIKKTVIEVTEDAKE